MQASFESVMVVIRYLS